MNDTEFQLLVNEAVGGGVPVSDICRAFSVSGQTVRNWMNGCSSPHPAVRDGIAAFLRESMSDTKRKRSKKS